MAYSEGFSILTLRLISGMTCCDLPAGFDCTAQGATGCLLNFSLQHFATFLQTPLTFLQTPYNFSLNSKP